MPPCPRHTTPCPHYHNLLIRRHCARNGHGTLHARQARRSNVCCSLGQQVAHFSNIILLCGAHHITSRHACHQPVSGEAPWLLLAGSTRQANTAPLPLPIACVPAAAAWKRLHPRRQPPLGSDTRAVSPYEQAWGAGGTSCAASSAPHTALGRGLCCRLPLWGVKQQAQGYCA